MFVVTALSMHLHTDITTNYSKQNYFFIKHETVDLTQNGLISLLVLGEWN